MSKTITCQNWQGGDVEKTREEFSALWEDEIKNLRNLTWRFGWADRVDAMRAEVRNEAGREFDRIWAKQNS